MRGLFFFLVMSGLTINTSVFGQLSIDTKHYSKEGKEVSKEQSFYYEMRKKELSDGDTVVTYYSTSNKLRSLSIVSSSGTPNGSFAYYYENGQLKSKGIMKFGNPAGTIISYYPSGKTQAIESFDPETSKSLLINYYDSVGNQIVNNGAGNCGCNFDSYSWFSFSESGKVVDGLRDSVWTGYDPSRKQKFLELYRHGTLESGESYDSIGNKYTYLTVEDPALPENGLVSVYEFIGKKLKYPTYARRRGIQGKVFIEFIVNKDGSISDVKCLKGIGGGCDEEAVRVINLIPDWNAGKLRGMPAKQRMILPITFKLG